MIVNLYVDHLMSTPPASAEEVWNATREHPKVFADAAARIGLSPSEYREFQGNLLDGKAVYVRLPRRLDAMSGDRRGSIYAVKNAEMNTSIMGWRVALADGNVVYVPQICGNISLLKHAGVAQVNHKKRYVAYANHVPYTPTIGHVTPVVVTPPEVPEAPVETAPTVAQAVPAAAAHGVSPLLFGIPAAVGGILYGITHGSTTPVPSCSQGSNAFNACQK